MPARTPALPGKSGDKAIGFVIGTVIEQIRKVDEWHRLLQVDEGPRETASDLDIRNIVTAILDPLDNTGDNQFWVVNADKYQKHRVSRRLGVLQLAQYQLVGHRQASPSLRFSSGHKVPVHEMARYASTIRVDAHYHARITWIGGVYRFAARSQFFEHG